MKFWDDLSANDRTQIALTVIMVLAGVVIVLYAIAASRGNDVDYFKERLGLLEQRLNYMDQKVDRVSQTQAEHRDWIMEIRRLDEAHQRQLDEQQRWIEYWKSLPQLPKPSNRR